jgi:hypothetical protein
LRSELEEENSFQVLPKKRSSKIVVLSYCSPMKIQRALRQPRNATIDILVVVAVMDASDHTPYIADEIQEVALMDDRYVLPTVFDR